MPQPHPEPFFDPLPAPDAFEPRAPFYPDHPWEPPRNVVPVPLATSLQVARTADTVLVVTAVEVYPRGMSYELRCWLRPGTEPGEEETYQPIFGLREPRLGWLLPDGTRVGAGVDESQVWENAGSSLTPQQVGRGSEWSGIVGSSRFWLYPLPTGETWTLVLEWPARGIPETRVPVDATPIHAAAAATGGRLWALPPTPEGAEYGWFGYASRAGSTLGPAPDRE